MPLILAQRAPVGGGGAAPVQQGLPRLREAEAQDTDDDGIPDI